MKPLLSLLLIIAYHAAYSQEWEWARQVSVTDDSWRFGEHVASDKEGNVYLIGRYNTQADFGNSVFLTGSYQRFIAKYSKEGNILWAQNIGQVGIGGIVLDDSSNVYIAGSFGPSSLTIGSTTLSTTSGWDTDVFVAKYDSSGTPKWAKKLTGGGNDGAGGIVMYKDRIYITGHYTQSLTYESIFLNAVSGSYVDAYLLKLDLNGNGIWGRQVRQTSVATNNSGVGIAVCDSGNIYLTGGFINEAFSGAHLLTSAGNTDIFTAKYDSLGNLLWTRRLGGGGTDSPFNIAVDRKGNAYIYYVLDNYSTWEWARYNTNGDLIWSGAARSNHPNPSINDIAVDDSNYVYLAGTFHVTTTFGSWGTTITETPSGSGDAYIAKFDSLGNALKVWRSDGSGWEWINSICIKDSIIYATGTFTGEAIFGDTTINAVYTGGDIFLAKLSRPSVVISSKNSSFLKENISVYPNPFRGSITFSIGNPAGKNYTLSVFNSIGELKYHTFFSGDKFLFEAENFSQGIYLYVLSDEQGRSVSGKMVAE